jgi:epoxyqueuosine reductase
MEQRAKELGFDDAAVVPADTALPDVERVRESVSAGRMGPLSWMSDTLDQRVDLRRRLPWAKSVLVALASYWAGDHEEHGGPLEGKAKVSRYAWGRDYHHVLRRKLRRLRKELLQRGHEGARCAPFNDVDAVLERAWAQVAGLGFIGKSAMLIHRGGLGSWTFIGGLVTDVDLGSRLRPLVADGCGSCTACLDACPTKAFLAPRVVDANRCLVTWNVEEPDAPQGDAAGMTGHGWAVGCDVCQEVCPWNNKLTSTTRELRFLPRAGHVAFAPDSAPTDIEGTPLARPGQAALPALATRALKR